MSKKKIKKITGEELDELFDRGEEDIMQYMDLSTIKMHYPMQRITIDFPKETLEMLDVEAAKIGVTRTSLIKVWIADCLAKQRAKK
ncbi:MAG: CopG family transcriptional regulator [Coxiellaceae bacterium]|nr:CopG family transcriptional regulator [Coxiellaceae bacterium]